MENNDHNIPQIIDDQVAEEENSFPDELSVMMDEQEENEQILRFEEDLASNF
jgi:hypothetical protein